MIATAPAKRVGDHYVATLERSTVVDDSCWFALRTLPPPVKDDPELQEPVGQNEFGGALFAHTSPIYVQLAGQGVFDAKIAAELVAQMKSDWETIAAKAVFDDDAQRDKVHHVYREAIDLLEKKLARLEAAGR